MNDVTHVNCSRRKGRQAEHVSGIPWAASPQRRCPVGISCSAAPPHRRPTAHQEEGHARAKALERQRLLRDLLGILKLGLVDAAQEVAGWAAGQAAGLVAGPRFRKAQDARRSPAPRPEAYPCHRSQALATNMLMPMNLQRGGGDG